MIPHRSLIVNTDPPPTESIRDRFRKIEELKQTGQFRQAATLSMQTSVDILKGTLEAGGKSASRSRGPTKAQELEEVRQQLARSQAAVDQAVQSRRAAELDAGRLSHENQTLKDRLGDLPRD